MPRRRSRRRPPRDVEDRHLQLARGRDAVLPAVPTRRRQRDDAVDCRAGIITEVEPARSTRNETLLQTFFVYLVGPAQAEGFFRREADAYREKLAELERFAEERVTTRSERASALTVDAGIRVLKARIDWAERAAEEVSGW